MNKEFWNKMIVILIVFLSLLITALLLFLLIDNRVSEGWQEAIIGFTTISASLSVAFIIIPIIFESKQRKKEKKEQTKRIRKEMSSKVFEIPAHHFEQIPIKEIAKDEYLLIEKDNTNGEYNTKICQLCNEEIGESTVLFLCPQCSACFHEKELFEWLQNKDGNCPCCDFSIKKQKK